MLSHNIVGFNLHLLYAAFVAGMGHILQPLQVSLMPQWHSSDGAQRWKDCHKLWRSAELDMSRWLSLAKEHQESNASTDLHHAYLRNRFHQPDFGAYGSLVRGWLSSSRKNLLASKQAEHPTKRHFLFRAEVWAAPNPGSRQVWPSTQERSW